MGRYPLSFVKWIFRTGQLNHDGDRKTSGVMTLVLEDISPGIHLIAQKSVIFDSLCICYYAPRECLLLESCVSHYYHNINTTFVNIYFKTTGLMVDEAGRSEVSEANCNSTCPVGRLFFT